MKVPYVAETLSNKTSHTFPALTQAETLTPADTTLADIIKGCRRKLDLSGDILGCETAIVAKVKQQPIKQLIYKLSLHEQTELIDLIYDVNIPFPTSPYNIRL